jgi:hypothetical protein
MAEELTTNIQALESQLAAFQKMADAGVPGMDAQVKVTQAMIATTRRAQAAQAQQSTPSDNSESYYDASMGGWVTSQPGGGVVISREKPTEPLPPVEPIDPDKPSEGYYNPLTGMIVTPTSSGGFEAKPALQEPIEPVAKSTEMFSVILPDGSTASALAGAATININGTDYPITYSSDGTPNIVGAPPGTTLSHLVPVGQPSAEGQQYVQKYQIADLDPAAMDVLKREGIEGYNLYVEELQQQVGGYKNLGWDESMGGYVWEDAQGNKTLTPTEVLPIFAPEVMVTMGQEEQEAFYKLPIEQQIERYNQQIPIAQEKVQEQIETSIQEAGGDVEIYRNLPTPEEKETYYNGLFVTVGNNEKMIKTDYDALPIDVKETIDKVGITGYREQILGYEATLAPYQTTLAAIYGLTDEDLNNLTPTFKEEYLAPYYDLSKITLEEAEKPEIREAVAAMYPSLNLEQLGKMPLDSNDYEQLKSAHDRNLIGKYNNIEIADWYKYYPITAIPPTEYQAKKASLISSGLSMNEVNKIMSNYYMATGNIEEFKEFAKNQQLDVTFQPSMWQRMTPWQEQYGESVTLQGGTSMALDILVPGYFVATNWSELNGGEKGLNIALDVVSLIPFVGAATLGARGIGTASKFARVAAVGKAVGRELGSQAIAPVTMVIHPIGTVKATYRTVADLLEDVLDPRKVGEAVLTTSNHTVKLRIGQDITLAEAKVFSDELVNSLKSADDHVIVEILNDTGNGVRIEFPQSPLMKEVGGGVTSGTPFGEEWMRQVDEQGFAVVSSKSEGGKMYFSLEPHSRFAFSTAGGIEGTSPTMLVFDKESTLFKNIEASQKLYKAPGIGLTKEVEVTAPAGTIVLDKVPEQILYTRVGVGREVMEIWLTKPLTARQLAKLKALNLIERVKAPFKAPVKVTRIGEELEGLTEAEIRTLADVVDEAGNIQVARRLRAVANSRDVFAAGARVSRIVSLDRFDPVTGRVRSIEEPRASRDVGRETLISRQDIIGREPMRSLSERKAVSRMEPERIVPSREVPARDIDSREVTRIEPTRAEPPREEPVRDIPPREIPLREVPPREIPAREEPTQFIPLRKVDRYRIPDDDEASYKQLTQAEKEGSVAWRQGKCYWLIYPPYGAENKITSGKPFPNMEIHTGAESAFKTLQQRGKGKLPKTIKRDMGIMDITIVTGGGKGKKPKMKYKLDRYQSTDTTPRITRM